MSPVEVIGILASVLIIISMSCSTSTYKSTLVLRVFNIIGSVIFVLYGLLLPAYSTAFLNAVLVGVNVYHAVKVVKERKTEIVEIPPTKTL